jgi:hypothetical protein
LEVSAGVLDCLLLGISELHRAPMWTRASPG